MTENLLAFVGGIQTSKSPVTTFFVKQFNYNITKEHIITVISLIDLPELQMVIAWLEVVGVLVDLLGKVELDKFKLISLVTNYTRRLQ
jgi:hypothetical protein